MVPKNKTKILKKEGEKKSEGEKRKQGGRAVKETCTEKKSSSGISWNNYKINFRISKHKDLCIYQGTAMQVAFHFPRKII